MREALEVLKGLVKESEGCVLKAYPDPGTKSDPWTIGWGHTGKDVYKGLVWTQKQADDMLDKELKEYLETTLKASPSLLNESGERQAAIADFVYNCGLANYKSSTLKKEIDKGNFKGAREQIIKWNKAAGKVLKGLVIRRNKESELLK